MQWIFGVTDGTRTHDTRDHNPVLYQLSYSHHATCPPWGGLDAHCRGSGLSIAGRVGPRRIGSSRPALPLEIARGSRCPAGLAVARVRSRPRA
jgi:hypothetical protein